jgi:hypothetical protein
MLTPQQLHEVLEIAPMVTLRFANRKRLNSYRQMLYSVNVQGRFRYRTQREGQTKLHILRLK